MASSWTIRARTCPTAVEGLPADVGVRIYVNLGPVGRFIAPGEARPRPAPRAAWVVGPRSEPIRVSKETADSDIVGVRLRPGVASIVLGVPLAEVRGAMVDLEHFWGDGVDALRAQLAAECTPASRLDVLERAVLARADVSEVPASSQVQHACRALAGPRPPSVASLADQTGVGHRRLIAMFDRHAGLKPREVRRVLRFRHAMRRMDTEAHAGSSVAHASGFTDQSHFIREFRRLSGLTPTEYRRRRNPIAFDTIRLVMAG